MFHHMAPPCPVTTVPREVAPSFGPLIKIPRGDQTFNTIDQKCPEGRGHHQIDAVLACEVRYTGYFKCVTTTEPIRHGVRDVGTRRAIRQTMLFAPVDIRVVAEQD